MARLVRMLAPVIALAAGCFPSQAKVAAFGDSVTWGYGGRPGGWVTELEERTGEPIANLGDPGETAAQAEHRITGPFGLALAPQAEVVLLLHGGNDMNRAFHRAPCNKRCDPRAIPEVDEKYDEIGRHLRAIAASADRGGRKVVLATYWPPSPVACGDYDAEEFAAFEMAVARVNEELVEIGAERGHHVVRLDDLLDLPQDPRNFYDCLHPSGQGYARIAQRWLEEQDEWLPENGFRDD